MKHFTITTTPNSLTIKRNLAGVLHLRLALIFSILIASGTIAFLVNRQIMHLDSKLVEFAIIFVFCIVLGVLIFYWDFFKNSFSIAKSGGGYLINHHNQLEKEAIEYILEEGYTTRDHIEGFKKIRIKTATGVITIGAGVSPIDRQPIIEALLSFLEMDVSSLRSLVW